MKHIHKFIHKETKEIKESVPMKDFDQYEEYSEPLQCPMCNCEAMEHKELENKTHIYICPDCPFIGIEWYDDRDTENLNEYLKKN